MHDKPLKNIKKMGEDISIQLFKGLTGCITEFLGMAHFEVGENELCISFGG